MLGHEARSTGEIDSYRKAISVQRDVSIRWNVNTEPLGPRLTQTHQ